MASNISSQAQTSHPKRSSFSSFPGGNAAILLEKSKPGIRGSTPDSEALASSDDEQDHYHRLQSITNTLGPRAARRSSWLTEVQALPQRKASLSGSTTFSPTSSHPPTPPADSSAWGVNTVQSTGATIGRSHSNSTSFPWASSSAIWNAESQKGPPLRLTEVLPSPKSLGTQGSAGAYHEEAISGISMGRDHTTESAIPFAIPLHPTLKTYRSQSYSVGQLEPEPTVTPLNYGGHFANARSRNSASYAGLQHRPSRPSMLGELPHDASLLGQLREVDDDDESSNGSEAGVQLSATRARTIEQLAMENAVLRHAAADQIDNNRGRNRAISTNSTTRNLQIGAQRLHQPQHEIGLQESEYAIYEADESTTNHLYDYEGYSLSGAAENRTLETVKKGQWQSSLGFGGLGEIPQSRRHSFADVPTRQTSISSADELPNELAMTDKNLGIGVGHGSPARYREVLVRPVQGDNKFEHLRDRNFAASYFSTAESALRSGETHRPSSSPASAHQSYNLQGQYGRSQHLSHAPPRPNQLLYVVTFKACRADVFYVQEGTGLQVTPGDLVIVEADRGTDLGTVAHENVTWTKAKELKEQLIEEHYRWLMLFSRHGQNGIPARPNPNGQITHSNGAPISAVGGMGLSSGHSGVSDISSADLKPKLIKRLAQAHEIQTLKDKEGNEAKAKRVCQQKVVEHRLNMEILDAEFQVDWKKLTFYYFADSYINFNPLVTDLFKIYKTRIWMSAINPASFVTPVAGLQLPSGLGPGAFGPDLENYTDRRQQKDFSIFHPLGLSQAGSGSFDHIWDPSRDSGAPGGLNFPHVYTQTYQPHDLDARHIEQYPIEYSHVGQQAMGLHPRLNPNSYNVPDLQHSSYAILAENNRGGSRKSQALDTEWTHSFQSLSLGS